LALILLEATLSLEREKGGNMTVSELTSDSKKTSLPFIAKEKTTRRKMEDQKEKEQNRQYYEQEQRKSETSASTIDITQTDSSSTTTTSKTEEEEREKGREQQKQTLPCQQPEWEEGCKEESEYL
jgi:preprotein translocase subunit SecD